MTQQSLNEYLDQKTKFLRVWAPLLVSTVIGGILFAFMLIYNVSSNHEFLDSISHHVITLINTPDRPELTRFLKSVGERRNAKIVVLQNGNIFASSDTSLDTDRPYAPPKSFRFFGGSIASGSLMAQASHYDGESETKLIMMSPLVEPVIISLFVAFLLFCFVLMSIRLFSNAMMKTVREVISPIKELESAIHDLANFKKDIQIDEFEIKELENVRQSILLTHSELEKRTNLEIQTRAQERLNLAFRHLMHDLFPPISNIKMLTNQLIKKPFSEEMRQKIYGDISRLTAQTLRLVESAKQNVPFEINPVRGVDVCDVIKSATVQAVASVDRANSLQVEVDLPEAPIKSDIDPINMERAVTNLVKNAIEAAKSKVVVRATRGNFGQIVIGVDDDGSGLESSDVSMHLIGRGTSTKSSDRGLGLSSTNRIVKSHGGQVVYSTSSLGGAAFEIRIENGKA